MSIFAIGDLHLSLGCNKEMNIFAGWHDYVKRLDKPARDADLADMIRKQQEKCDRTYGYRRM